MHTQKEIDNYLKKWTGYTAADFDIKPTSGKTAKEAALNVLNSARKNSVLDKFAVQTVIYLDGETVWRFEGGQVLNYKPPPGWFVTITTAI